MKQESDWRSRSDRLETDAHAARTLRAIESSNGPVPAGSRPAEECPRLLGLVKISISLSTETAHKRAGLWAAWAKLPD